MDKVVRVRVVSQPDGAWYEIGTIHVVKKIVMNEHGRYVVTASNDVIMLIDVEIV